MAEPLKEGRYAADFTDAGRLLAERLRIRALWEHEFYSILARRYSEQKQQR